MNKKSPAYVLFFMAAICLVFGTSIAVVNYATLGLLEKNKALHENSVLCRAFQIDVAGHAAEDYEQAVAANLVETTLGTGAQQRRMFKRTTPGHESVGFLVGGMGFWDRIETLIVLTPDLKRILNVQFMDQKETPGLGARIEERWFTDQFQGLQVAWDAPVAGRVIVGAASDPNARNRVDGITGATQTSMALMNFLNQELELIRTLNPTP